MILVSHDDEAKLVTPKPKRFGLHTLNYSHGKRSFFMSHWYKCYAKPMFLKTQEQPLKAALVNTYLNFS
jgi:hypothetical protein